MRGGAAALCVVMATSLGCGPADVGAGSYADAARPDGEDFEFAFGVYEIDTFAEGQKGLPVANALVAIDLPDGSREAATTGADGHVTLSLPQDVDWMTWTAAVPGLFPVTTFYRATLEELRGQISADGEIYALVERQPSPVDSRTSVGVACSTRCCVSRSTAGWCMDVPGETAAVLRSSQPFPIVAMSKDDAACPKALSETMLSDTLTEQSVEIDLSAPSATEASFVDMTLILPTDPTSPLAQEGVYVGDGHPARAEDNSTNRYLGFSCRNQSAVERGLHHFSVGYFPKDGVDLDLEVRAFAPSDQAKAFRWSAPHSGLSFPTIPAAGSYQLLDSPRLMSPTGTASRASRFSWQPIEGAKMYELHVQTDFAGEIYERIDRTLWLAVSWSHQAITLPEPPAGYDPEEQWGEPTVGAFRVIACDRWLPWSHRRLWWEPRAAAETACGFGRSMAGPLC